MKPPWDVGIQSAWYQGGEQMRLTARSFTTPELISLLSRPRLPSNKSPPLKLPQATDLSILLAAIDAASREAAARGAPIGLHSTEWRRYVPDLARTFIEVMQAANPGRKISTEKKSELACFISGAVVFITGENRKPPAFARELAKFQPRCSGSKR